MVRYTLKALELGTSRKGFERFVIQHALAVLIEIIYRFEKFSLPFTIVFIWNIATILLMGLCMTEFFTPKNIIYLIIIDTFALLAEPTWQTFQHEKYISTLLYFTIFLLMRLQYSDEKELNLCLLVALVFYKTSLPIAVPLSVFTISYLVAAIIRTFKNMDTVVKIVEPPTRTVKEPTTTKNVKKDEVTPNKKRAVTKKKQEKKKKLVDNPELTQSPVNIELPIVEYMPPALHENDFSLDTAIESVAQLKFPVNSHFKSG